MKWKNIEKRDSSIWVHVWARGPVYTSLGSHQQGPVGYLIKREDGPMASIDKAWKGGGVAFKLKKE